MERPPDDGPFVDTLECPHGIRLIKVDLQFHEEPNQKQLYGNVIGQVIRTKAPIRFDTVDRASGKNLHTSVVQTIHRASCNTYVFTKYSIYRVDPLEEATHARPVEIFLGDNADSPIDKKQQALLAQIAHALQGGAGPVTQE